MSRVPETFDYQVTKIFRIFCSMTCFKSEGAVSLPVTWFSNVIGGSSVNKAELAAEIAARTNNTKKAVEEMLAALTDVITEVVAKGDRVTLVGFGTFERRNRNARETNNPQKPGEKIKVPAKRVPAFAPGKEFKERVDHK
jgi:DNA-binding protein HU-beta